MARPGDVLDIPTLGVRIEFRTTTEESGGELVEFDLVGRPRGFITLPHVHPLQSERHEVIEGRLRIRTGALERLLGTGEVVETHAGVEHSHGSDDAGRFRVQVRPANDFEPWLERIAELDRDGELLASGFRGRSPRQSCCSTSRARRTRPCRRLPCSRPPPARS